MQTKILVATIITTLMLAGNLMLRIPAEIHAAVASAAEASGKSINQWAAGVLDKESHAH